MVFTALHRLEIQPENQKNKLMLNYRSLVSYFLRTIDVSAVINKLCAMKVISDAQRWRIYLQYSVNDQFCCILCILARMSRHHCNLFFELIAIDYPEIRLQEPVSDDTHGKHSLSVLSGIILSLVGMLLKYISILLKYCIATSVC